MSDKFFSAKFSWKNDMKMLTRRTVNFTGALADVYEIVLYLSTRAMVMLKHVVFLFVVMVFSYLLAFRDILDMKFRWPSWASTQLREHTWMLYSVDYTFWGVGDCVLLALRREGHEYMIWKPPLAFKPIGTEVWKLWDLGVPVQWGTEGRNSV